MESDADAVIKALAALFPPEKIHWKPQTLTKDGSKAMAVPYIDARDVMDRLDAVVGPQNWSDSYVEMTGGQIMCQLRVKIGGEWVAKSDVGGQSDQVDPGDKVKAATSDALKRAAVKFGIARYIYSIPKLWFACEVNQNGKFYRWKEQPRLPAAFLPPGSKFPSAPQQPPAQQQTPTQQQAPPPSRPDDQPPPTQSPPAALEWGKISARLRPRLDWLWASQDLEQLRDRWLKLEKEEQKVLLPFKEQRKRDLTPPWQ